MAKTPPKSGMVPSAVSTRCAARNLTTASAAVILMVLTRPPSPGLHQRRSWPDPELGDEVLHFLAAGHHLEDLVARDLAAVEGSERAPAVEEGERVADRIGVVDVVGDEDDRDALV